jgi:predicted phosphoadenosine phosphosulfate sulfurtransferase
MRQDLRGHPDAWENPTLDRFLGALTAVLEGMESAYHHRGETLPTEPTWRLFAEILVTASGYE